MGCLDVGAVKEDKAMGEEQKEFFYVCIHRRVHKGSWTAYYRAERVFLMQIIICKQEKVLQNESWEQYAVHSTVLKELWDGVSKQMIALTRNVLIYSGFVGDLVGRGWTLVFDIPLDSHLICLTLLLGESIEIIVKNTITRYLDNYNMLYAGGEWRLCL